MIWHDLVSGFTTLCLDSDPISTSAHIRSRQRPRNPHPATAARYYGTPTGQTHQAKSGREANPRRDGRQFEKANQTLSQAVQTADSPETVFGWHRQLVKRKWTRQRKNKVGCPPTDEEVKKLVIQFALENNWGYGKIEGELTKLGIDLSETAIRNILQAKGLSQHQSRLGLRLEGTHASLQRATTRV